MKFIPFYILLIIFLSCNNKENKDKKHNTTPPQAKEEGQEISSQPEEIKGHDNQKTGVFLEELKSGKLSFKVESNNTKDNKMKISISGLEKTNYMETFDIEGKVEQAFLLDINKDNYIELYIVLSLENGTGNKKMIGIASFRNKSAGEIHVQGIRVEMQDNSDSIKKTHDSIRRVFTDAEGKVLDVNYVMAEGEAGYRLIPNMRYRR